MELCWKQETEPISHLPVAIKSHHMGKKSGKMKGNPSWSLHLEVHLRSRTLSVPKECKIIFLRSRAETLTQEILTDALAQSWKKLLDQPNHHGPLVNQQLLDALPPKQRLHHSYPHLSLHLLLTSLNLSPVWSITLTCGSIRPQITSFSSLLLLFFHRYPSQPKGVGHSRLNCFLYHGRKRNWKFVRAVRVIWNWVTIYYSKS